MDYIALSSARNGNSETSGQGEMTPNMEAPPDGRDLQCPPVRKRRHNWSQELAVHRRCKQAVTVTIQTDIRVALHASLE